MSQKGVMESVRIMPEHCGGDLRGANEMRAACDEFFRRRGMNAYGGMAETVKQAAERGIRRREARAERRAADARAVRAARRAEKTRDAG